MTHAALVGIAVRWLKRSVRCGVVLREHAGGSECPDAIGWRGAFSTMVECKISRSDFLADRRKDGRQNGLRLAHHCYYLTFPGIVTVADLPPMWGLLELGAKNSVHIVRRVPEELQWSDDRGADALRREVSLLYRELRRYQAQGIRYRKVDIHGGYADDGALGSLAHPSVNAEIRP